MALALEGVRVLDLSRLLPGGCCSPTSAPTSSRSRTPEWATTSAGRPRTSRAPTRRPRARFAADNDCCLEPVLEIDEALESELVRAREMVIQFEQPGAGAVRGLGFPVKLSSTPGDVRLPGAGLGEHTDDVLRAAGYGDDEIAALKEAGAVAGPAAETLGTFMG